MRILLIIIFITQFVAAQHLEESKITCSHAFSAEKISTSKIHQAKSQSGFDVIFYDINIQVFPDIQTLSGYVGITGQSEIDELTEMSIDLSNSMDVDSIKTENGEKLNYTRQLNSIDIDLNDAIQLNQIFKIIIYYSGSPQATGYGSLTFKTVQNQPMISTLSEPYGARDWWPCKDTPLDKADSVDISVKVPANFVVASNGLLVGEETDGDWKIFRWQERYPIATYLVSLAIYPYLVLYDWYYTPTDSMRLEYYVYSDSSVPGSLYSKTSDMLHAFAPIFGEYPFIKEKYGHAQFTWGGSMEHQTLSSMGSNQTERTVAHELAHQWWGDMVTCSDFHHIWLNEGFATYSEALWSAARDNDIASLHNTMSDKADYYFSYPNGRSNYVDSRIYVADTTSQGRIFDYSLTYQKASWVLHMLRHLVGDTAFFEGLQEYGNRYRFKSAVTAQFQQVMEDVSGIDLNSFFQRWIYGESYPIYSATYNFKHDALYLLIRQSQTSDVFKMPIDIKATFTDNSEQNWVVQNNAKKQFYTLPLMNSKTVKNIEIDPENWILRKVESITFDPSITLDTTGSQSIPTEFNLSPVYPNPFNAETTIKFALDEEGEVQFSIFDIKGNRVWMQNDKYEAGIHTIKWNGIDQIGEKVPSGTYIIRVNNGKLTKYRKMLLLK